MDNMLQDTVSQIYIVTEDGRKLGPFKSHDVATMYLISENIAGSVQTLTEQNQNMLLG